MCITDCKVQGNTMTLTIALHAPQQSKSALAKAAKANPPIPADKVPANLVASTGGFTRFGNHAISLNVLNK